MHPPPPRLPLLPRQGPARHCCAACAADGAVGDVSSRQQAAGGAAAWGRWCVRGEGHVKGGHRGPTLQARRGSRQAAAHMLAGLVCAREKAGKASEHTLPLAVRVARKLIPTHSDRTQGCSISEGGAHHTTTTTTTGSRSSRITAAEGASSRALRLAGGPAGGRHGSRRPIPTHSSSREQGGARHIFRFTC